MKFLKINMMLLFIAAVSHAGLMSDTVPCDNKLEGVVAVFGKAKLSAFGFGQYKEIHFSGVVVSAQNKLPPEPVKEFVETGFYAYAESGPSLNLEDCQEGVFIFSLGRGNVLPLCDGKDLHIAPALISFNCVNK